MQRTAAIQDIYQREGSNYYKFICRPSEKCTIENMFLPEIYTFFSIDDDLCENLQHEKNVCTRDDLLNNIFDLLQKQRILLIVGDYGSGKTVLLKALHHSMNKKENLVVFSHLCLDLFSYIKAKDKTIIYSFWDRIYEKGKKHFILLERV